VFRFQVQVGSRSRGSFRHALPNTAKIKSFFLISFAVKAFPMISSRPLCLHTAVSSLHLLYTDILGIHNLQLLFL
jgi:hypothetical protein